MTHLVNSLISAGPLGVFIGMVGESAGLPVPSEVLLPFAGFLVLTGRIGFGVVFLIALVAQVVGSLIGYAIGYFGGRPLVARLSRVFGAHGVDRAEAWFSRWGRMSVFWGRFLPVVRTYISWPAGVARMPIGSFLFWTILGSIPWSLALIYAGILLGSSWATLGGPGQDVSVAVLLVIVLTLAWIVVRRRSRLNSQP